MEPISHTLKDGRSLLIRTAEPEDSAAVIAYTHAVSAESDNLTFGEGEFDITEAQEVEFLAACKATDNKIYLLAYIGDEIVGTLSFMSGHRPRIKHRGEFGMTVRKAFWGLGIGALVLDTLIGWARGTGFITKINLTVRTDNARAIALYERKGFVLEGTLTREMIIRGEVVDCHCMGLQL